MDSCVKTKLKINMFLKAWERCKSLSAAGSKTKSARNVCNSLTKSKSWHCTSTRSRSRSSASEEENIRKRIKKAAQAQVAPAGCFSVYVGEEKQRFVIKAEFANHPLFKILLEDAELEYGFNNNGPLWLPCDVELFYKVLAEMYSEEEITTTTTQSWSSSLPILCSPLTWCSINNKMHGSYRLLTPSKMLKLNLT